jgi:alpha-L-rhamnosidase
LPYRIHDVASLLLPGQNNVLAVEVAEGWYAGRLGFRPGKRFLYGKELGLYAQLEIHVGDDIATPWTLVTDGSWLSTESPLLKAEIYDGETYDMNQELTNWNEPGLQDISKFASVRVLARPSAQLVAPDASPIRVTETVSCQQVFKSESGKTILDFGQNLVGKLFIPILGLSKGEKLVLRHAEVMEGGELGTRPLQDAKAQDVIIGSGEPLVDWSPKFTYHGFQYVEVTGWPGDHICPEDIQATVIHTDMRRRGYFVCSNPYVNRLHANVVWSMRGNFLSLPTDCPQRDERLGWTGDIQIFCPTASFLYDTTGILRNWLHDVAAEQLEDGKGGIPPLVVPYALADWPHFAQAIWNDVTVLLPNDLYQYSSDQSLLEQQFESMQTWLEKGVDIALYTLHQNLTVVF